jgi:hypothetical protein
VSRAIIAVLAAGSLIVALTACGRNTTTGSASTPAASTSTAATVSPPAPVAPVEVTSSHSARAGAATDLGPVKSDLSAVGSAADAAGRHVASGDAAASNTDAP